MNRFTIAAQTIKDTISAQDVGRAMGLEIRHGRCQCPLHGGHDFNCRLYPGNRGYMCWVCKSSGDVISLVRNYYHDMSFRDTISWFNSTFGLGLDIESPMSPEAVKQAENARKKHKEETEFAAWKDRMAFDIALTADKIVEMLENQRDCNVPKYPDDPWNRDFCEAIRTLPAARRFAQRCMFDCLKEK